MSKKLFVLVGNCGDGSFYPQYTFDEKFIDVMQEADNNGTLDYESVGCDADGFHYDIIYVPEECTYESLGISDCSYEVSNEEEE